MLLEFVSIVGCLMVIILGWMGMLEGIVGRYGIKTRVALMPLFLGLMFTGGYGLTLTFDRIMGLLKVL